MQNKNNKMNILKLEPIKIVKLLAIQKRSKIPHFPESFSSLDTEPPEE